MLDLGRYDEAGRLLAQVVAEEPENGRAWCLLARAHLGAGRYADAVETAITAINAEPLRESAQRVLAEAHLGEGNWVEAHRGYVRFREIMHRELGVEPSREFSDLVFAASGPRASARPA